MEFVRLYKAVLNKDINVQLLDNVLENNEIEKR